MNIGIRLAARRTRLFLALAFAMSGCLLVDPPSGLKSRSAEGNGGTIGSGEAGKVGATAGTGGVSGGHAAGAIGTDVAGESSGATNGSAGESGAGPATAGTGGSSAGQSGGGTSGGGTSGGRSGGGTSGGGTSGGDTSGGGTSGGGTSGGGTGGAGKSSGCGMGSTLSFGPVPNESGTNVGTGAGGWLTISSSGQTRGFIVRLPDNYDRNLPYPLVFVFHAYGATADQLDVDGSNGYGWAYYGLQRTSHSGAIFVAPQGLGNGWANTGGQDVVFIDDLVKLLKENLCVDTTHITTVGFSAGGGMSYALACARASVFHAAVIYEGAVTSGCAGGADPIALWQVQGNMDATVPISSAVKIRDKFVANNTCTPQQEPPRPDAPPPYLVSGGHLCADYAGCSSGHPVRWCVSQSGHSPSPVDGTSDLYNSCTTPSKGCSATCPCSWTPDNVWSWLTSF